MALELPKKSFNLKQITDILVNYDERFEALADLMDDYIHQPILSGAQILEIFFSDDETFNKRYYMVSDFIVREPFFEFYHFVPTEDRDFDIRTFPNNVNNLSVKKYIKNLEKDDRWNKIYENVMIPSVSRMQWMGRFTYSKKFKNEEVKMNLNLPHSEVVQLKSKKDIQEDSPA